jgi:hypothetical protein
MWPEKAELWYDSWKWEIVKIPEFVPDILVSAIRVASNDEHFLRHINIQCLLFENWE